MATSPSRRSRLSDFVVAKEIPAQTTLPVPPAEPGEGRAGLVALVPRASRQRRAPQRGTSPDGRIGQTLRLSPEAWEQLRVLAARERLNAHDLLIEAVNRLFRARDLPEIA